MWKKAINRIHNRSADSDASTKATDSRQNSNSPSINGVPANNGHLKSSTSFHSAVTQPTVSRASVARVAAVTTDTRFHSRPSEVARSVGSYNHRSAVEATAPRVGRQSAEPHARVRGASRPRDTPPQVKQQLATPPTETSTKLSNAPGLFTEKGTPADLTKFFETKPWNPNRFTRLQRLAPAIHGEVSLYHDNLENKDVVIKQLANSSVRPRGPQELENPLVEIGAMTYLFSSRALYPVDMVAKLEGVYQDDLHTYMVTEYCTEGELFKEVVRRKNLSERHVKAIALQLALALYSLHKNGICHRDVSLENTLIQSDHTVRLIDFGQAECCYEDDGSAKMMHGSAGKAYYRAPEMLRGPYCGQPVDVFALGVEIFIMAIGSPPWAKASLQDQRYRSLTKYRTSLDISLRKWGKRDGLSDAFVDILSTIFTSNPKQRPTIEQLLCHPWFSYDASVWTWVDQRGVSCTIREHAIRVEMYLKSHPQGAIEEDENDK